MTAMEQREAARKFVNTWRNKGYEKGETQSFWISLMTDVLGIDHATDKIIFEKEVIVDGQTKFIDGYIAETRVLIEQKSLGKDLNKKSHNQVESCLHHTSRQNDMQIIYL